MIQFINQYGGVINLVGLSSIWAIILLLWIYGKKSAGRFSPQILSVQPVVFREPKKDWVITAAALGAIGLIIFVLQIINFFNNKLETHDSRVVFVIKLCLIPFVFSFIVIGACLGGKNNFVSISLDRIEFRLGRVSENIEARFVQSMTTSKRAVIFYLQDGRKVRIKKYSLNFTTGGKGLARLIEEFGEKKRL